MIEAGTHGGFIVASYLLAAMGLIGLCLWIIIDGRTQRRRLAELEAQGIRRRSAGSRSP